MESIFASITQKSDQNISKKHCVNYVQVLVNYKKLIDFNNSTNETSFLRFVVQDDYKITSYDVQNDVLKSDHS